jgi:tetratricopeptide (TPR) repeat protein
MSKEVAVLRSFFVLVLMFVAGSVLAQDNPGKNIGFPLTLPDWAKPAAPPSKEAEASTAAPVVKPLTPFSEAERKQIRKLATMPYFETSVSIRFDLPESARWSQWAEDTATQIAGFEKSLEGSDADAEALLELAYLYEDKDKIKETLTKSADQFRRRIGADPKNGWLRAQLAEVLLQLEEYNEALEEADNAVQQSPNDWRCWRRHAEAQFSVATTIIWGGTIPLKNMWSWAGLIEPLVEKKLSEADLGRIASHLTACAKALDRMVETSPEEAGVYRFRVTYDVFLPFFIGVTELASGREIAKADATAKADEAQGKMLSQLRADLAPLLRLEPEDPDVLMIHACFTMTSELPKQAKGLETAQDSEKGTGKKWRDNWKNVSADSKKSVLGNLQTLEAVAQKKVPCKSAVAAQNAAILNLVVGNHKKTVELARLLVKLEPKLDLSWDLLERALMESGSDEAYDASLKRLQANATARNHYLHAQALIKKNDTKGAEREVRAGLKKDPENAYCQLGLAALLLRNDSGSLEEARALLKKAQGQTSGDLWEDYAVLEAIELSLSGDSRGSAFRCANILERYHENTSALRMLKILSGSQPK